MKDVTHHYCRACGAEQHATDLGRARCWMCRADLGRPDAISDRVVETLRSPGVPPPPPGSGAGGSSAVIVAAAMLALLTLVTAPGLAIMAAIFMVPAAVGILQGTGEMRARGRKPTAGAVIGALVTAAIAAGGVVVMVAFGSLFLICAGGMEFLDQNVAVVIGIIAVLIALGFGAYIGARVAKSMVVAGKDRAPRVDDEIFD